MGGGQSGVARLRLVGGGAVAARPPDALAGMRASRGSTSPGIVRTGGPPAGGRVLVQAVRDVPRSASGQIRPPPLKGAGAGLGPLPAASGARWQGGDTRGGPCAAPYRNCRRCWQCDSARASRRRGHGSRCSPRTWSAGQRPSAGRTAQGTSPG